ncbi:hypothetical protein KCU89_g614, partial [Aureobasidium melanogenum]
MAGTMNFPGVFSYDQGRAPKDVFPQTMFWGTAQNNYPQYSLPPSDLMLDSYASFPGLYSQSASQDGAISHHPYQSSYQFPYQFPSSYQYESASYLGQGLIQDGAWRAIHGVDFDTGLTSNSTPYSMMPGLYGQASDQVLSTSASTVSSGSARQLQLMEIENTKPASPTGTETPEDLITYMCEALCRAQNHGSPDLPISRSKASSIEFSLRFVVDNSVHQGADQETSPGVQPEGLAQQLWEQVVKAWSSRISHIPGEHEICISRGPSYTKIQTRHRGVDQ